MLYLKQCILVNVLLYLIFSLKQGHKVDVVHHQLVTLWSAYFCYESVAVPLNHQLVMFLQEFL